MGKATDAGADPTTAASADGAVAKLSSRSPKPRSAASKPDRPTT
jgi:hypothetical protein